MNDPDTVLPADDNNFQDFKKMCESVDGWSECYNKKNVCVSTSLQSNSNLKLLKAVTSFNDCSAATIFDVVHDTEYRRKWDHDMIDMKEVCKLCVNNTVSYYAAKCPPPVKPRDVVFLSSWIAYPNMRDPKEYLMINRSVSHVDFSPRNSMVRAISIVTGYLIRPTGPNSCEFTYLTHFDPRGSLPKWVVNKVAQFFTPKVIHRIHKAARKYEVWKRKHNASYKPWLWPEQCRLPLCKPGQLSARFDEVEIIDETGLKDENGTNGDDPADVSDDEI
ncbi:START domain-containing protein 10-like [Clavelina lepadiformis]|uniref:START domain-containing protein 10-like n=1 Tax=Clavelina lepadiformis TaxID=159417 RepID=UPI004043488F